MSQYQRSGLNSVNLWKKIDAAELLIEADELDIALEILNKSALERYPVENLNFLRAVLYANKNDRDNTISAAIEELNSYGDNERISALLDQFDFQFYCPVCRNPIHRFLAIGSEYETQLENIGFRYKLNEFETFNAKNYKCPTCFATDYDRILSLYLNKKIESTPIGQKINILNVSNSNALINFINWHKSFESKNVSQIDILNKSINSIVNNSLDIVVLVDIIQKNVEYTQLLIELKSKLKENGEIVILSPVCLALRDNYENSQVDSNELRLQHYADETNYRLFSKKGISDIIINAGLKSKEMNINDFNKMNFQNCGINKKSTLYIGIK